MQTGIIGDKEDLIRRKKKYINYYSQTLFRLFNDICQNKICLTLYHFNRYGENSEQEEQKAKFIDSIKQQIMENKIYWGLAACGAVSMITGFISEKGYLGWT